MSDHSALISIITVVFNRVHDIEYTLSGITGQTYPKIEYIVIDGGSTDGTIEILQRYSDKIQVLISEKDKGIYDAMNKGLLHATGEYVLFINGGDNLHGRRTIEEIVTRHLSDHTNRPDIIYGECMLLDPERNQLQIRSLYKKQVFPESLDLYSFKSGTNVSHQSFMVRRAIAPLYNLSYKWSSDIDWMLRCIQRSDSIQVYHGIISEFVIGDSSEKNKLSSLKERFSIMSVHYGLTQTIYFHTSIIFKRLKEILF